MSSQSGNRIAVNGGRSSVGRAPDCDSGGRGFNPHRPPHFLVLNANAVVSLNESCARSSAG